MKVGVLTVSDKGSRGERTDTSGPAIKEMVAKIKGEVVQYKIVPDEPDLIKRTLIEWSDQGIDLILTTGGTGFSPRDNTPEATSAVIEKDASGISEAIRWYGLQKTPKAMLSRGISGIRKRTLIVNLPGSEKAVRESLEAIIETLPHAIEVLRGDANECAAPKKS
jgi:molybdopterin adenylyltransferase